MIPLHAQRTDHADELCWHLPPTALWLFSPAAGAPPPLSALLDDGTLVEVRLEGGGVVTRLAPSRDWQAEGPRVRTALHSALASSSVTGEGAADDAALREDAERLLAGQAGDQARSHGGRIEVVAVREGVVEVDLQGACHGCPAARTTLTVQLESRLRALHPDLRAVRTADVPRGRPRLFALGTPAITGRRKRPAEGEVRPRG